MRCLVCFTLPATGCPSGCDVIGCFRVGAVDVIEWDIGNCASALRSTTATLGVGVMLGPLLCLACEQCGVQPQYYYFTDCLDYSSATNLLSNRGISSVVKGLIPPHQQMPLLVTRCLCLCA